MDDKEFLEKIKNGKMSIDEGLLYLKDYGYKELGFAKLDFHRKKRRKFGEVIFCQGKEDFALIEIFKAFYERGENVLGTRANRHQFEIIKEVIEAARFNETAGIISVKLNEIPAKGNIAICTGGTADLKIAEEARLSAQFFGAKVTTFYDIGVSGIHRLISKIDEIRKANIILAVAGMEGALPTVIAGQVDKPVIAVPTSVGYGAGLNGIAALLTMINSCADGISVVNIDNGFGAAYQAAQINLLIERSR